jgi:CDP-diacylglycerol--glycerol-3-phosphate 3-phosphatidyltransferase
VKDSRHPHYHRIRTWPNALSAARGVMAILAAALFAFMGLRLLPVLICIAASLLDLLDGWLARRTGQISRLGEHLDPLADKVLITVIYLALALFLNDRLVLLLVFLLLLREWGITWIREHYQQRYAITLPAGRLGKWKMLSQGFFGIFFLLWMSLRPERRPPDPLFMPMLLVALSLVLVLSYASALRYVVRLFQLARRQEQPPD